MTTTYPAMIDTDVSLPSVVDTLTPVQAVVFNRLRDAVLAIESALGVEPQGVYGTTAARIGNLENTTGNLQIISLQQDLGGTLGAPFVVGLQGRPLSTSAPTPGEVLTWNGIAWLPLPPSGGSGGNFTAGGDLSGSASFQTVVGLQDRPISSVSPSTNQVLGWNGTFWIPTSLPSSLPPSGTAGGNLSGSYPNPVVVALQNNPVSATSPTTGQVLEWNGSVWIPATVSGSFSAGGDLSGSSTNQTVIGIQGVAITSSAPSSNQVLVASSPTTGIWQQVADAQVSASAAIQGTKISPNFGSQNILTTGTLNVGGATLGATVVSSLQDTAFGTAGVVHNDASGNFTSSLIVNADVSSSAAVAVSKLAAGTSAQVLLNNATPTPTWTTLSGDVTVSSGGITRVGQLQGTIVLSGTPSTGQVLTATGAGAADWQTPASGSFSPGTDLAGGSTSQEVIHITGAGLLIPFAATIEGDSTYNSNAGYPVAYSVANVVMPSDANLTLSNTQLISPILRITSTPSLTATRSIILPITVTGAKYDVYNGTTGGQSLLFIGSSGTGVTVPNGLKTSIYFDGTNYVTGAIIVGGDLTATTNVSQTVASIQGVAISGTPSTGYVLTATGSSAATWQVASGGFTAGGDLSGSNTSQTVIGIQAVSVSSTAPTTGQVLEATSSSAASWTSLPTSYPPNGSAGGDLSGTYPNPGVANIHGASVPASGGLTTGNVLQVSGSAVLTYAPINLAGGSNYVTGTLPATNLPVATTSALGIIELAGDLGGTDTSPSVLAINGTSVPATPTAGQTLVATSGTSATWELLPVASLSPGSNLQILLMDGSTPTWTTISQDVFTNATGAFTVQSIQQGTITCTVNAGAFEWWVNASTPGLSQVTTSAGSGANFIIQAQGATGASHNGGELILSSGTSGSATVGNLLLQTGGTTQATITPTSVTLASLAGSGAGYVAVSNTGLLSWSAGPSGVTWADDLSGNGTSTSTAQYVSSLSYSSSSAGGTININGTGTSLNWAAGNTGPSITQSTTSSATAANFTLSPQVSTNASGTPGSMIVNLGVPTGSGTQPSFQVTQAGASPSQIFQTGMAGSGVFAGTNCIWLTDGSAPTGSNPVIATYSGKTFVNNTVAIQLGIGGTGYHAFGSYYAEFFGIGIDIGTSSQGVISIGPVSTIPTRPPTSGFLIYNDQTLADGYGLAVMAPSTHGVSTVFETIAPTWTGDQNTHVGVIKRFGGLYSSTSATLQTIITVPLPTTDTSCWIDVIGIARAAGGANSAALRIEGLFYNNGTVNQQTGTVPTNGILFQVGTIPGTTTPLVFTISGTNILIQVEGASGSTYDWTCYATVIYN
jgi:trimeric autotransporter adhesin